LFSNVELDIENADPSIFIAEPKKAVLFMNVQLSTVKLLSPLIPLDKIAPPYLPLLFMKLEL